MTQADKTVLVRLLADAGKNDIKEAIKNAMMIGNKERILRAIKEVIEEIKT